MDQKPSFQIGPRTEYLFLVLPMLVLLALFILRVFTYPGFLILIVGGLLFFLWRGGHSLTVDAEGIREKLLGVCFRRIEWYEVIAVVCYPDSRQDRLGQETEILILLDEIWSRSIPEAVPEWFHFKHPFQSIYIDYGNFIHVFSTFTDVIYYGHTDMR